MYIACRVESSNNSEYNPHMTFTLFPAFSDDEVSPSWIQSRCIDNLSFKTSIINHQAMSAGFWSRLWAALLFQIDCVIHSGLPVFFWVAPKWKIEQMPDQTGKVGARSPGFRLT